MYEPKLIFLEAELNYRREQLKGLARNRRRHHRPRGPRSVEADDNAR